MPPNAEKEIDRGYYESTGYFSNRNLDMGNGVRSVEDISEYIIEERINVYPNVNCQDHNKICIQEHGSPYEDEYYSSSDTCKKCPDQNLSNKERYDFDSEPEALITEISYEQALAYYHWKYELNFDISKKEYLIYYSYFPSEEQFKKIQSGDTIPPISVDVPYATPFFRYVVHVYPK